MSDDDIMLEGEPLTPEEIADLTQITDEDIDDAIDWWNEIAADLYVGALEWNA